MAGNHGSGRGARNERERFAGSAGLHVLPSRLGRDSEGECGEAGAQDDGSAAEEQAAPTASVRPPARNQSARQIPSASASGVVMPMSLIFFLLNFSSAYYRRRFDG